MHLICASGWAGSDTWYPPGHEGAPRKEAKRRHSHAPEAGDDLNPLVQGVRFFQKFISPVDSPRCPMYPTCSTYALQALHRHGPVVGSFLTVDRLLHETSPEEQTIPLEGFERIRYYDPLDANDFWLESSR
jgi:putative membrane protein insertion efficiency factor